MKIWVAIKQVPDTETRIKLSGDNKDIDRNGIKWIINPYDEFAIEEALKLKEKCGGDTTVTVVSFGPDRIIEAMRTALAMGCDAGVRLKGPEFSEPHMAAQALAEFINTEKPDIIFMGKQAIDDDSLQVPQLTAEYAGYGVATVVTKFELKDKTVFVEREIEGGAKEQIEMNLPCIVATHKGINTPRYASLPGIMKAKKKEIKEVESVASKSFMTNVVYSLPPERKAGKVLKGDTSQVAKDLVRLLREEAKVI